MSWGNVPDDWGSHYRKCHRCGGRYHASEGGCSCRDHLECMCGDNSWEGDEDDLRCTSCGTGSIVSGRTHRAKHRARKEYGNGYILRGDLYERIVTFGYYPGGAFTLRVQRKLLEKGPNWIAYEVTEA